MNRLIVLKWTAFAVALALQIQAVAGSVMQPFEPDLHNRSWLCALNVQMNLEPELSTRDYSDVFQGLSLIECSNLRGQRTSMAVDVIYQSRGFEIADPSVQLTLVAMGVSVFDPGIFIASYPTVGIPQCRAQGRASPEARSQCIIAANGAFEFPAKMMWSEDDDEHLMPGALENGTLTIRFADPSPRGSHQTGRENRFLAPIQRLDPLRLYL